MWPVLTAGPGGSSSKASGTGGLPSASPGDHWWFESSNRKTILTRCFCEMRNFTHKPSLKIFGYSTVKLVGTVALTAFFALGCAWAGNLTHHVPVKGRSAAGPGAVIKKISRQFIGALKEHKATIRKDPAEVQNLVHEYILPYYDLMFTTHLILGRYWDSASPSERKAFAEAFINHLIAVYEKGIVSYSNDRVQVLPVQGGDHRQFVSVTTLVHIPGHKPVAVGYAMHKMNGRWKIFDVKVMGISFVLTYRNEYQSEIKRTGLQVLINHLKKEQLPHKGAVSGALPGP